MIASGGIFARQDGGTAPAHRGKRMYRNILVPIDPAHGEVGERIIAVAKLLAGGNGRITLLTVMEPIPSHVAAYIPDGTLEANRKAAAERLRAMAERTGLQKAVLELRDGGPSAVILEEAGRLGVDAIVLGSHRQNYGDYLIGSTASRVVRHARCSVIVERSAAASA
jgi:nucleotide-binding universal stress UspA family protein